MHRPIARSSSPDTGDARGYLDYPSTPNIEQNVALSSKDKKQC